MNTKAEIAITPPLLISQQPLPASLQSISIILGIVAALAGLITFFFKVISKFNEIELGLRDLREDFKTHAGGEGHEKVVGQVRYLEKEIYSLDKRFDIHSQNYINRQEVVQMLLTQLNEKIDHKSQRWEGELKEIEDELKQLQRYLQKKEAFLIRDTE